MWWADANFEGFVLNIRLCGKLIQEKEVDRSVYDNYHTWFDGRNMFIGTAYVIMGALCKGLTILFFVKAQAQST